MNSASEVLVRKRKLSAAPSQVRSKTRLKTSLRPKLNPTTVLNLVLATQIKVWSWTKVLDFGLSGI